MAKFYAYFLFSLVVLALASHVVCDDDLEENDDETEETGDGDSPAVEDSVLVMNSGNFDDIVNNNPTVLVEFYAPWCGHCKNLAPEYSAAAEELGNSDPPVVLGKVDATVHSDLAQRFSVQGYPTLVFFKNGQKHEYDGPRTKEGIIDYMKTRAAPNWEPEPEAVITLTSDDFDEVVENEPLMLVEFYAPWCGHCKRLAPIYEKAAKQLKNNDPPILLAKVDATVASELASRYEVTGYPTLKVFRKGRASEYKGERNGEYDFIYYMRSQVGDGAKEIKDAKMLKAVLDPQDITIVAFFDSEDDPKRAPYKELSDDIREDYHFGITFDDEVRKVYKVNSGSVVIFNPERFYTKHEPKWYVMEIKDDTTADDIKKFVTDHHFPLVGHYSRDLKKRYDATRPLCLVFYTVNFNFENREATQLWRKKIADVAKKFPGITFAVADEEENANLLEQFGLGDSGEELNVGLIGSDNKKYGMEPMEEYDSDDFIAFLNKYNKGKLKPHIKSQRVPKKQSGPVTVVVGDSFEKIVQDTSKDVLIELYAPWCGHCKNLEPTYASLAKKLKKEKNLVIAKMDATANDAPDNYSATGFPTIYFAPSNNKEAPIKYNGGREVEDFEKFLKEHATVSFGKNAKEEL